MYQVLYRKWRPQTFSDVAGQNAITGTLKNEIKHDRLAHAYLFTGSRGTGKTTCAKILAKAVNCLHPVDGDPCNECEICRGIDNGTVLDISEIDAASNNGVDNIRALREEVHFTPTAGKYRVYIIDEVHMLSVGAFNALLKTLEEPPAHVIFILATTEVHKVPATVLSRCQRFDFNRIADSEITARLQQVAKGEGFVLNSVAATMIARLAEGGMRDALSILDRCAGVDTVDVERVNQIVGLADTENLFRLSSALSIGDMNGALKVVDELYQKAGDVSRLCDQLIDHFRNIMLAKAVGNPSDLMIGSPEDVRNTMNAAEGFTMGAIMAILTALQNARERMRNGVNQRVELEMALLTLTVQAASVATVSVQPQPVVQVPPQPKPRSESIQQPTPEPKVDLPWQEDENEAVRKTEDVAESYRGEIPPPFGDEDVPSEEPVAIMPAEQPKPVASIKGNDTGLPYFDPWTQVIERLTTKNRMMAATLMGSDAYLKDGIVLIRSKNPQFVDLIRQAPNRAAVRDAIEEVTGQVYRLGPYKEETVVKETDPLADFMKNLQGKVNITDLDKKE